MPNRTSAKRSPPYTSRLKLFHRFSSNQLRAAIVIFAVATIGVWTLLFSSAATPAGINFVLMCPPQGQTCNGSANTVASNAKVVQSWYANQLGGGRTFVYRGTTVRYAPHATSYYSDTSTTTAGHMAVLDRIATDLSIDRSSTAATKTVVVMGFPIFHNNLCGFSYIPGSLSVSDPFAVSGGCGTLITSIMAHEMAHNFALAHNGNAAGDPYHRTDGTLMDHNVCASRGLSNCAMNATDRAALLQSSAAWFPSTTTVSATSTNPPAVPSSCIANPTLTAGHSLSSGQSLLASNCYKMIFQADGNLVVRNPTGTVLWASGSNGKGGARLVMQADGNLVVYTSGGTAIWNSRTNGSGANRAMMQTDGNFVIYTPTKAVWASKSGGRLY